MVSPVYAIRRSALARTLRETGGGIAIVATAPEQRRSGDSEHPYRYDSHFHYLSGFAEPEAWLLVVGDGRSLLLCRPRDAEREIWEGQRLGATAAVEVLGVDEALPIDELDATLERRLDGAGSVWLSFGAPGAVRRRVEARIAALAGRAGEGVRAPSALRDLDPLLAEMRLKKDAFELATMRRAAAISAAAHRRAMRFVAARMRGRAAPLAEYELEAELLHEFRRSGAAGPAYPSIVATGANACVLHHPAGDAELKPGALCLIDAGCELDGYASDITRTFPVDGRFSPAQRELYEIVLAAQVAAIAATRPGARQREAHHAALRVLSQGMLDCGLLDARQVGDVDAVVASAAYRRFYPHGTGHWLGRDVHDVGDYLSQGEAAFEQPDGRGGTVVRPPSRVLQPGMVVTVEPGLYVRAAADVPERFWDIGIRIEDDAVLTEDGCELISRSVPVAVDEIEALMR